MKEINNIGVVGAGAWGTTLGLLALRAGSKALVWSYESDIADEINTSHTNTFLPNVQLDHDLRATTELGDLEKMDVLLIATPAQHLRTLCFNLSKYIENIPLVICSKGIEDITGKLLSEVITDELPESSVAVLSGPTLAPEIAKNVPAAITLASPDSKFIEQLTSALGTKKFRPYGSNDIIGAQVGGAVKNVLAIASGIITGKELGGSARSALITRGMAEMIRIGCALGGHSNTLMGLSGLGDLVLTCTSKISRNMSLGIELGKGIPLENILSSRTSVAEGISTSSAVCLLAKKLNQEMPISNAVNSILHYDLPINEAIESLLERPFKTESDIK